MLDFHCPGACVRRVLGEMGPGTRILDYRIGDVAGEGWPQDVYLVGVKPLGPGGIYCTGITLVIAYRSANICIVMPLGASRGYDPRLYLIDLTGDGIMDICISIFSGERDGRCLFYVYSFAGGRPLLRLDNRQFAGRFRYSIICRDDHTMEIHSRSDAGAGPPPYCRLHVDEPPWWTPCRVESISALAPQLENGNFWGLLAVQPIIRCTDAKALGAVHTHLLWNGYGFEPRRIQVISCADPEQIPITPNRFV